LPAANRIFPCPSAFFRPAGTSVSGASGAAYVKKREKGLTEGSGKSVLTNFPQKDEPTRVRGFEEKGKSSLTDKREWGLIVLFRQKREAADVLKNSQRFRQRA